MSLFIGIDDTDAGDSIGTGALARELAVLLERDRGVQILGITRHQLFVHPDIPYTSHNSSACIEVAGGAAAADLHGACRALISYLFHPGADPGLCIARPDGIRSPAVQAFSRRAKREIVRKDEAIGLAAAGGAILEELGGTGLGVIGALAACGLRASGDDGRFLALPGARQVTGEMTVSELKGKVPIDLVVDENDRALEGNCLIDTRGWVRPELREGRVVLPVERQSGRHVVLKRKGGDGDL